MSNTTDEFGPESTQGIRVQALADALAAGGETPQPGPASLTYTHTDGITTTVIDRGAPLVITGSDARMRELAIARAVLIHALRLVDRELNEANPF
jgi:hypothetical protein